GNNNNNNIILERAKKLTVAVFHLFFSTSFSFLVASYLQYTVAITQLEIYMICTKKGSTESRDRLADLNYYY
ncbi:hypothetical protein ACJX0J_037843, partial [Zea mays]